MKTFIILVIGCALGWSGSWLYGQYLYSQVQAESGGDMLEVCRSLLESENN